MDEDGAAAVENKLLKSQIAVLEQRVEVYEKSVLEKTDELYAEITKRKLVEERLKEKDQFMEFIVQGSAVAFFVINPEHKVIYWNKACEDLTGIKSEEILGTNEQWKAFYDHPRPCVADIIIDNKFDEMTNLYPDYGKSVLTPNGIRTEGWYPNIGGKNRYIVFDAAPTHDVHGKISAAIETLQDITERKRVEEDLRESQEYTKVLFTSSHIPLIVMDAETGIYMDCNAAAVQIYGYATREEVISKTPLDVSAPIQNNGADSATEAKKHIQACLEKGSHLFEWRHQRPNGQIWDADVHLMLFQHRGKSLIQFALQDITERKKAEQALQESETQFRTLFESAFDAIFLVDQNIFVDCNQKTLEMYGCTREQIIGQAPCRFSPEVQPDGRDSLEKAQEKMNAALNGQPQFFEWKHCRYDGTLFDAEVSLTVFSVAGKKYLQGLVHDITERKQMERALAESAEKYRTVFETTGSATIIVEEDMTISLANSEYCRLSGYPVMEIEGKKRITDSIHNEDLARIQEYRRLRIIDPANAPRGYEMRIVDKQGRVRDVLATVSNIPGTRKTVASLVDITESKQAEVELRSAHEKLVLLNLQMQKTNEALEERTIEASDAQDKAEAANKAKSAFLASMSHELRTPMNAILGYSQLMQRDPSLHAEQLEYLNIINRSGEHLLALINDVLEISKIEAHRMTLDNTSFDLHALFKDLENMFRIKTNNKDLLFEFSGISELPRYIVADENMLRQILINLLGNAVKFTEVGGIVTRMAVIVKSPDELRLVVEIEDTGMGIADDEQGQLFQFFEQTSSGRQTQGGTGLGLAISREYARLMGGDITVSSQAGLGSTFRLEIKTREGRPSELRDKNRKCRVMGLEPGQGDIPRILVVDDQLEGRKLLGQLLEMVGLEVKQASNGLEAVELFEQWHPALIWMDVRMPVMDGLEATRRIKATEAGKRTTVVAVSASVLEEERTQVLAAGCDDFVRKPYREDEIFEVMARYLGVKYTYKTEAEQEIPAEFDSPISIEKRVAALDADVRRELYEAVIRLDTDQTVQVIGKIMSQDAATGRLLKKYAENFEFETLLSLFEDKV